MLDATAGLNDYRSRALRASLGGVAALVVGGAIIGTVSEDIGGPISMMGALALFVGLVGLVRVWRIRWRAARSGWRMRTARFRVADWGRNGQPALLLEASDDEPEAILSVSTTVFRWDALRGADELWVVGDPRTRFAAVATADGQHVVVVKRPWSRWWGNRLRTIVAA